jgi:hypothetical protein
MWLKTGHLRLSGSKQPPKTINAATAITVITGGLILNLDARNTNSYPGSGAAWRDLTTNHNDATLYNGVNYGAGYGGALSFSGVGTAPSPGTVGTVQYGQVNTGTYFNSDFTIESWVYVTGVNNWQRIIDFGNGAGAQSILLSTTYGGSGAPGLYIEGSQFQSTKTLELNKWNRVCATYSTSTQIGTIYVNGVAAGTQSAMPRPTNTTRLYCYIGRSEWAGDGMFQGGIGSIQIYNRTLSSTEMLSNYNTTKSYYTPLGA